jgi:hypothetical protein
MQGIPIDYSGGLCFNHMLQQFIFGGVSLISCVLYAINEDNPMPQRTFNLKNGDVLCVKSSQYGR